MVAVSYDNLYPGDEKYFYLAEETPLHIAKYFASATSIHFV